jgi:hypothetical protein
LTRGAGARIFLPVRAGFGASARIFVAVRRRAAGARTFRPLNDAAPELPEFSFCRTQKSPTGRILLLVKDLARAARNISARARGDAPLVPSAPRHEMERAGSPKSFSRARGVRGSSEFFSGKTTNGPPSRSFTAQEIFSARRIGE